MDRVAQDLLCEPAVVLSLQVLGVRPASLANDKKQENDWRTYRMVAKALETPGQCVEPLNPETSSRDWKAFYLFQTPFLITVTSLLVQRIDTSDLKSIPKLSSTSKFPYCESAGECSCLVFFDFGRLRTQTVRESRLSSAV